MSGFLQVSGLRVHYGVIEAVKGIDLNLERGKITTLLGANGAGKSTTLLALSGLIRATAGSVVFDGVELQKLQSYHIVAKGLVQVPEGREILTSLTVRENLLLGAYRRQQQIDVDSDLERLLELFPRLRERVEGAAGNLSGGARKLGLGLRDVARRSGASEQLPVPDAGRHGRDWMGVVRRGADCARVDRRADRAGRSGDHASMGPCPSAAGNAGGQVRVPFWAATARLYC